MIILLFSCENGVDSESEPLEFASEPSDEMRTMFDETPSDFTWEFFRENILIRLQSEVDWEGEIVLSGFQLLNGEIVDRITTNSIETNDKELLTGLSTGNLLIPAFTITDWGEFRVKRNFMSNSLKEKWGETSAQHPIEIWEPGKQWSPSEIEGAILSEVDLGENEILFVVYAQLAGESPEREQTTQPFGLLMREE
jgi:hypothetical protein